MHISKRKNDGTKRVFFSFNGNRDYAIDNPSNRKTRGGLKLCLRLLNRGYLISPSNLARRMRGYLNDFEGYLNGYLKASL